MATNSTTDKISSSEQNPKIPAVVKKPGRFDKTNLFWLRLKRRILSRVILARGILLFVLLVILAGVIIFLRNLLVNSSAGFYLTLLSDFVRRPADKVTLIDGNLNFLILGKGGANHDAPDLTDTIMFVSVFPGKQITLISLPRDIWIPELRAKLNSMYYWGNKKQEGGGLVLAKSTVEQIVDVSIQHAIVVDFEGFREIIDILGGVDVTVENPFVDTKYPIAGRENEDCGGDSEFNCRYETIRFDKGVTHMDGEIALKYARSRNAEGDEGTDFARAKRQQLVISAVKNKVLTREVLLSPSKLLQLKTVALQHVETDINPDELGVVARLIFDTRKNIVSTVLPEELLINPPKQLKYDNLYVFIPKDGNWSKVHEWVKCVASGQRCN